MRNSPHQESENTQIAKFTYLKFDSSIKSWVNLKENYYRRKRNATSRTHAYICVYSILYNI